LLPYKWWYLTRKGEVFIICILIVAAALPFLVIFGISSLNGEPNIFQEECICFSICSGERVSDLLYQLEKKGITSYETFQKIAREVEFTGYSFVPPPSDNVNRFEGLFAPGEYTFKNYFLQSRKANPEYEKTLFIVDELLERSRERFKVMSQKENLSIYDQIILASIVEKEAVIEKKHGMIASVFLNRLAMNMPIASCPTVEYSLGYHRPFLIGQDLKINSPYNVYRKQGLPPTPIAFFGDEALQSIINTPQTRYIFFVYDWTKDELYFSENYYEHQKNIALSKTNYIRFYGRAALYQVSPDKFYEH
jgi:UPF0755 protein